MHHRGRPGRHCERQVRQLGQSRRGVGIQQIAVSLQVEHQTVHPQADDAGDFFKRSEGAAGNSAWNGALSLGLLHLIVRRGRQNASLWGTAETTHTQATVSRYAHACGTHHVNLSTVSRGR